MLQFEEFYALTRGEGNPKSRQCSRLRPPSTTNQAILEDLPWVGDTPKMRQVTTPIAPSAASGLQAMLPTA